MFLNTFNKKRKRQSRKRFQRNKHILIDGNHIGKNIVMANMKNMHLTFLPKSLDFADYKGEFYMLR